MTLKEFIKSCSDDELSIFLTLVMVSAIKAQGISTANINPEYEKDEFNKLLNSPMNESLLDTINMYKNMNRLVS